MVLRVLRGRGIEISLPETRVGSEVENQLGQSLEREERSTHFELFHGDQDLFFVDFREFVNSTLACLEKPFPSMSVPSKSLERNQGVAHTRKI